MADNTFTGANLEFPNLGIHFILAEVVKFRKQLTVRQEFRSQSGWNNALNAYMGGIPGVLKAYFNVNEILSTVMMNAIAVQLMNFLLRGPMIDPSQAELASKIPQTARLEDAFHLARLAPTRLHLGALIAVILAILVYILLWRTALGFRIRAVGHSPFASRYAGINVPRYVVLALLFSGAFAGLAGAVQVYGVNYRMITDGSASGFTGAAGFNGIVAALFGQLHPAATSCGAGRGRSKATRAS